MIIIAIEGIDGSGKTLQFNMLRDALIAAGNTVKCLDFPNYNGFFGKTIGDLLSGKGTVSASTVDPQSMALWYALDRVSVFQQTSDDYDYLLLNRYVLSNAVYQSIRCSSQGTMSPIEMRNWIFELEHTQLQLPVPDLYLFLDVSNKQASHNVDAKGHREYVGNSKDVYESSTNIQFSARACYLECAAKMDNIDVIECMQNGKFLSAQEIHSMIMQRLKQNSLI